MKDTGTPLLVVQKNEILIHEIDNKDKATRKSVSWSPNVDHAQYP
jgi:hypothetical protein